MNEPRRWKPEEDARMLELVRSGLKWSAVARRLGRTYPSVAARLRVLGVGGRLPKLNEAARATLARMAGEGRPNREIAEALGVHIDTARKWRNRCGLPQLPHGGSSRRGKRRATR